MAFKLRHVWALQPNPFPHIRLDPACSSQRLSSSQSGSSAAHDMPLKGVRILEFGQLIAGPFAGQLLGQFGAEVIKVEPPKVGDPLRVWRELDIDGTSPWFISIGRNKKSVAIDLRKPEGRELVRKLALKSDVILENFKPGTESGFRYINGYPDPQTGRLAGAPVRPNISLGDSVAGLHAAFGTVLALLSRQREDPSGASPATGKTVDVSIVESMLNLMEGVIPEYDRKGKIRGPSGSSITGIVPTNAYPCRADSPTQITPEYVVIGGNGDTIYTRFMTAIDRPDLIGQNYENNQDRVAQRDEIETAISAWTSQRTADEVIDTMNKAGVPVGRVVLVKEVVENPQFLERGAVRDVDVKGWTVKMQDTFPVLDGVDPQPTWAGPDLGTHTDQVLVEDLDLTHEEIHRLRSGGIIG